MMAKRFYLSEEKRKRSTLRIPKLIFVVKKKKIQPNSRIYVFFEKKKIYINKKCQIKKSVHKLDKGHR